MTPVNILNTPFWVVTKPSPVSELVDICFECTFARLQLQYLGGLRPADIHGIYTGEGEATRTAMWLLDQLENAKE